MNPASAADYLHGLTVTQGARAGQPFEVLPWQSRFLRGALRPGVLEAALTMARGGGKSTFTAGLGACAIDGPLAQPNAEVLVVAASLKQAKIIFRHVCRFLGGQVEDRKQWRKQDTVNVASLENRRTGVLLELRGANPATLHGAAPSLVISDELAQWPKHYIEPMLAALETSLGKIPGSRIWKIGTRAASSTHPFEAALRTADYTQIHAARPDDPPFWKRTWARACPSLTHFPDLEAVIRREAHKAKGNPERLAAFRALRLNLGTADIVEAVLIEAETWKRIEANAPPAGRPVWGVDLGTTAASSAVAAYWPETGRLDSVAAFPAIPTLAERGLADGVGSLYVKAAQRGELMTTGGHAVDVAELLREALNRFGRPSAVVADRWREGELRDALKLACVPAAAFSPRGMGYQDGGADVRLFRRGCLDGRVAPVVSLFMRSAMSEARTISDPAGNAKLAKSTEGGHRARARDDAAAAAILAVAKGVRTKTRPQGRRWRYRGAV